MNAEQIATAVLASDLNPHYATIVAAQIRDGDHADAADHLDVLADCIGLHGSPDNPDPRDQMAAWSAAVRKLPAPPHNADRRQPTKGHVMHKPSPFAHVVPRALDPDILPLGVTEDPRGELHPWERPLIEQYRTRIARLSHSQLNHGYDYETIADQRGEGIAKEVIRAQMYDLSEWESAWAELGAELDEAAYQQAVAVRGVTPPWSAAAAAYYENAQRDQRNAYRWITGAALKWLIGEDPES